MEESILVLTDFRTILLIVAPLKHSVMYLMTGYLQHQWAETLIPTERILEVRGSRRRLGQKDAASWRWLAALGKGPKRACYFSFSALHPVTYTPGRRPFQRLALWPCIQPTVFSSELWEMNQSAAFCDNRLGWATMRVSDEQNRGGHFVPNVLWQAVSVWSLIIKLLVIFD